MTAMRLAMTFHLVKGDDINVFFFVFAAHRKGLRQHDMVDCANEFRLRLAQIQ